MPKLGIVTGVLSGWKQMATTLSPAITVRYLELSSCETRVEEITLAIGPESAQVQNDTRSPLQYIPMREAAMKNGRLHQAASQIVGVIFPAMPMHPTRNSWVRSIPVIIEGWEIGMGGSKSLGMKL